MPHTSLPSMYTLGAVGATGYDRRIAAILHQAELSPPQAIPDLAEPDVRDFEASLPENIDEARSLLVEQRTSEPGHQQADQQKRHIFRSRKQKAKCNTASWIFTKHEVAKAFNELLSRVTLPVPGVAQALLSYASVASVEELWCHLHDPKLEKRTENRLKKSGSRTLPKSVSSVILKNRSFVALETTSVLTPEITWLKEVCSQENSEYIRLMCQVGLSQDTLDRAFEIVLSRGSMDAMEILLSFGAVISASAQEAVREHVKLYDAALVRLLLSARSAMSVKAWQSCLEPEIQSSEAEWIQRPDLLLLYLANRPEMIGRQWLLQALESQNLLATATMLAYGHFSGDSFRDVRSLACEFASRVQDHARRQKFFSMLIESGFVADSLVLRQELVKDVRARQLPLIKFLADAGVTVDKEPHNAFNWAVSQMEFDTLELLKSCKFSAPASLALRFVPDSTSESDFVRLVEILGPIGLAGEPLDSCLICAVRRRQSQLVDAMIRYGASIEFKQASAVQTALENADLEILGILLRNKCSATILSATIPTAMVLKSRPIRLQAMNALIKKGVLRQELAVPLQRLVSEDGDVDSELIQLLLQHEAPVDGVEDDDQNVVLVAARKGNLSILKKLCNAKPRTETLSKAVPVAFNLMPTCGYVVALNMIKLLLQKGATGVHTHQTLIAAAKQDSLEIVRLLVEHGADANHCYGASFAIALRTSNFKLLQLLCAECPPSPASMKSVFFLAINPQYYHASEALELLLSSAQHAGTTLNNLWSSENLSGNPNITTIVSCLLRHGLDVDLRNGVLLSFAIQEKNVVLLDRILSANPSIASLRHAFKVATQSGPKRLELNFMRLLLEEARLAEIGQSDPAVLMEQAYSALSGNSAGLRLLVRHKAVASPWTFTKMCLTTASSSIGWREKQEIYESLLAPSAGILLEDMSRLLAQSVNGFPECTQLPQLLLAYGAEPVFETLRVALVQSSLELLCILLSSIKSVDTVVRTFAHVQKTTMASDRRYSIYKHLLDKGIPSADISAALIDALKADDPGDLSFPKLLLENGASPGYQNCKPFSLALGAKPPNSLLTVRLLTQYLVDDSMATVAFELVRETPSLKNNERAELYRHLLEWKISESSISQALIDNFKSGYPDVSVMRLLLAKGADPKKCNGWCLDVAIQKGALDVFRVLSKYSERQKVLEALLGSSLKEQDILLWFEVCLEQHPWSEKIDQDELLFQCMKRFPAGITLLNLLLDQGVSASAKIDYSLCAGWKPEPCTALIWALFQKPKIENDVIFVLLSRGDAALPAYSTPLTKVSAAFGCLLDKTRLPILKALLELARDQTSDYVIPGSSFGPLSMSPKVFEKGSDLLDGIDELPLREASLFLGNFEAFCIINVEMTPNAEMLHLAALLALPKFVARLLEIYDPNYEAKEFDNMTPLACVCASKPLQWCKIANEESDWKYRQKATMRLLADITSPKWRYRNMTILHWAMENGFETTKALIEVLNISCDPETAKTYLYKDRDGIEYSPQQYAMKFWDADDKEKKAFIACLEAERLKSRYYKTTQIPVGEGEPEHPEGHDGLPSLDPFARWAYNKSKFVNGF